MAEENILAVEGDEEFVECQECEGSEGYDDQGGDWIECKQCGGEGGHWRKRSAPPQSSEPK